MNKKSYLTIVLGAILLLQVFFLSPTMTQWTPFIVGLIIVYLIIGIYTTPIDNTRIKHWQYTQFAIFLSISMLLFFESLPKLIIAITIYSGLNLYFYRLNSKFILLLAYSLLLIYERDYYITYLLSNLTLIAYHLYSLFAPKGSKFL